MNGVNQTLYIPLYGKAYVSKRGIILDDPKAEQIWEEQGFSLAGKSRSRWLAYYLGIRAAVFDDWLRQQMEELPDAAVIHVGCGLDSRVLRVGTMGHKWYDVDFAEVISERKRHYAESADYLMLAANVRESDWLAAISDSKSAIVVMEGVSMYLTPEELRGLTAQLSGRFGRLACLMDCYTALAARLSKHKNPVRDMGVTEVYGTDDPADLEHDGFAYIKEHDMTPQQYINRLKGMERWIFKTVYAGGFSRKLYRLFEYGGA